MIFRYLRRIDWIMVACCAVLIICQVILDFRIPEYMAEITGHIKSGHSTDTVIDCGYRMLVCAFLSLAAAILTSVLVSRVSSALCRTVGNLQYRNIQKWSRKDLDSFSVASLITRSTNDINQLQQYVGRLIITLVKAPTVAVWALIKISSSTFEWTAVTLLAMVLLLTMIFLILWRGIPHLRKIRHLTDNVNENTREELEGMRTIRAYNADEKTFEKFDKSSEELRDTAVRMIRIISTIDPISASMMNFLTMSIYWIGAIVINSAYGDTGYQLKLFSDMIVFTSYASMVMSAVLMAKGVIKSSLDFAISSKRIEEVINYKPSTEYGTCKASDSPEPGSVSFDHVSFTYPNTDTEILHDVSFTIRKGETVAFIGPTASGKTTVMSLMVRLYDPSSGTVSLGGLDIREYARGELTPVLGYVPQTPVVYTGSIRNNLCFGEPADDEDLMHALRIAHLDETVDNMADGMNTRLTQHGWNLSGGQRQRLSLARVVYKGAQIYIFDDSFSALDSKTDKDLRKALFEETAGATKIIVAQRVGTIVDADRIIVLDKGSVVASGKHSELMESCELYREIATSQLEESDGKR